MLQHLKDLIFILFLEINNQYFHNQKTFKNFIIKGGVNLFLKQNDNQIQL